MFVMYAPMDDESYPAIILNRYPNRTNLAVAQPFEANKFCKTQNCPQSWIIAGLSERRK